jgi:hypothetical protein
LRAIPGALRFVEQRNVIDRRLARVDQAVVSKMVDVLDEYVHQSAGVALSNLATGGKLALDMIARQSFAQYGDQRLIAGQEDAM